MAKDSHGFEDTVFYVPKEPPHLLIVKRSDFKKIGLGFLIALFVITITLIFIYSSELVDFFTANGIIIGI